MKERQTWLTCLRSVLDHVTSTDIVRHLVFISLEVPWHDLQLEDSQVFLVSELTRKTEKLAFVELCCSRDSGLQKAGRNAKVPYVGVLDRIQDDDTFERVRMFVESHRQLGYRWIHIHCSTLARQVRR